MANWFTRGGCGRKAWKPPSSQPILIRFEFRNKRSLITVICLDPHSPNKLFVTRYCFLMLGDNTSFFFLILYFSFLFLLFYVIINFYKNYYYIIIIFFNENYPYFFFIFRNVPECSGMFHVPGFIDGRHDVLLVLLFWLGALEFTILRFLFFCCLNISSAISPDFQYINL